MIAVLVQNMNLSVVEVTGEAGESLTRTTVESGPAAVKLKALVLV
jgi:hypothetical protein